MRKRPGVILVASGPFSQTHIFKVCTRHFQAAGWWVGTVRIENCCGKTCLHTTDFGGWGKQPEQCLEFFINSTDTDPYMAYLREAIREAKMRKGRHMILFTDRYEEGFLRRWWRAHMIKWGGKKLSVVQVGENYSHRGLEYLSRITGGEYRRISHDKYIDGEIPALLEFVQ